MSDAYVQAGRCSGRLFAYLEDDFAYDAFADHRCVTVLGKEHRELTWAERVIGLRYVVEELDILFRICLLYTSPSPRDS